MSISIFVASHHPTHFLKFESLLIPTDTWSNVRVCCVFLIDGLTVSHLHPPAHRRPSRACCPWLTCSHQTLVCNRPGAIAKLRTTRTAAQPARSRAVRPEQGGTASGQPNACPKRRKRAAAWTVRTCSMMTRTTWMLALRILIMVSSSNGFFYCA